MAPRFVSYVDKKDLEDIRLYLDEHPLGVNAYRKKVGKGQSNTQGIVSRRCLPPDISRVTWKHPYLFKLLMEFAEKYVNHHISFTSIQINDDYTCMPHKDVNNVGESYIVGFGSYLSGELCIEQMDYSISYRGLLFNGSELKHYTKPWFGHRYSLVFHTIAHLPRWNNVMPSLSEYEVIKDGEIWKIRKKSDGSLLWGNNGLPHFLKGRKRTNQKNKQN